MGGLALEHGGHGWSIAAAWKLFLKAIAGGAVFYLARKCSGGSPLVSRNGSAISSCYTE